MTDIAAAADTACYSVPIAFFSHLGCCFTLAKYLSRVLFVFQSVCVLKPTELGACNYAGNQAFIGGPAK
eukprot:scaffold365096_cov20-Prasinocladus_malaysianus.AAC.1